MQDDQPLSPSLPSQPPGTNKQSKRGCNCKNSRCLKLYCECFSLGEYCINCNCMNCHNNSQTEVKHHIELPQGRYPDYFRKKS